MIYDFIRPLLFQLAPEKAHALTLNLLKIIYRPWLARRMRARFPQQPVSLWGLNFPNPVGLAAGFDKNGDYIDALLGLGFGFIEVGAVTPKPQFGHPPPRLFRLPEAQALINHMGFNNKGVDHVVNRLQQRQVPGIVGVNIGKNADTPLEQAVDDYHICLTKVYPYADYVTVNISSPNTEQLRALHTEAYLHDLLNQLKATQARLQDQHQCYVPLLLKIAPDLMTEEIQQVAYTSLNHKIDGLIAVNTSFSRHGVEDLPNAEREGGLSGKPLLTASHHVVSTLYEVVNQEIPIIAVGGIMGSDSAKTLLQDGAQLVQIYTGLIYCGPGLVREIAAHL